MEHSNLNTSGARNLPLGIRLVLFILLLIALKIIKRRKKKCPCKPPPVIGGTEGFTVKNNTQSITFLLTTASGDLESPPPALNTPLPPNGSADFEVNSRAGNTTSANIKYSGTAANGAAVTVSFTLKNFGGVLTGVDSLTTTGPVNASAVTTSGNDEITITDK
ncbi:hypothetical protein SAMN05444162_2659 [Paenibacillaceae bacterium GAS479]|nr:hypothetical protein SAMN05444162_2659 [Paenibacillaceae bacterium GAS479]